MKKMIFSAAAFALVAVSGIMLAPTTAKAIPAFARQTGAACLSCHFQTFPSLKPFGRAFKMGSFTDVGDQALIEDDNLSIPVVLNATFNIAANYNNTSASGQQSKGTFQIPKQTVLMVAGRLGSNTGAFAGFMGGMKGNGGSGVRAWQFLNSFDVGSVKIGVSAASTPFGGGGLLALSNVYGQHADVLGGGDVDAIDAVGYSNPTTAIGTWVGNQDGFIQVALIAPSQATGGTTNVGLSLGKLIRADEMLTIGGWDTVVGFGLVSGSAGKGNTAQNTTGYRVPMNLQFIDAQAQGQIGDMNVGIYADWAHAKGKTAGHGLQPLNGGGNFYGSFSYGNSTVGNTSGKTYNAYSIRVNLEPVNRILIGAGFGYQKLSGFTQGAMSKKIFHLAATYVLYQNINLNITFNNNKFDDPTGTLNGGRKTFSNRETMIGFRALM